ncbi:hypothetical protein V6N13_033534 [Hibiscus sabdariffa]|uniref:Uncharacterized protein n=1 Tax=Hibiscus sabdariffa TaxID=183260 RepID=A0ABR2FA90_9ROSI
MAHHTQHHNHNTTDGVSPHVQSTRFLGLMTRRDHSFKRNSNDNTQAGIGANASAIDSYNADNSKNNDNNFNVHHEIDLSLNSSKSEVGGAVGLVSIEGLNQRKGFLSATECWIYCF